MRLGWSVRFLVLIFVAAAAAPLSAQMSDDRVPRERTVPLREAVKAEIEASRYKLGPFYLLPQFGVSNFGYNNNVFGRGDGIGTDRERGDYTATVAAGTRFVAPIGRKIFIRGVAVPEYNYYQRNEDLRFFGGTYRASLLGLFNRMSVEVTGGPTRRLRPLNSEEERPVESRSSDALGNIELDIFPRLGIFGGIREEKQRFSAPTETTVSLLDRDDRAVRAGLRYHVTSFFDVSGAVEKTESDFRRDATRNNESSAVLLGVFYDRPRTFLNLSLGQRKGEGDAADYPEYSTVTGSYFYSHAFARPAGFELYGDRGVVNTLFLANPYFFETRNGLAFKVLPNRRLLLRTFIELGTNRYPNAVIVDANQQVKREDDVTGLGAGVAVQLYRKLTINVTAQRNRYESNIDEFDRSAFLLTSNLTFQGVSLR